MGKIKEQKDKMNSWNKKIEIKNEIQIKLWILVAVWSFVSRYLYDLVPFGCKIWQLYLYNIILNVVVLLPSVLVYIKKGIHKERLVDNGGASWIIWGFVMFVLTYAWRFAFIGFPGEREPMISVHMTSKDVGAVLWFLLYYTWVGLIEEFEFRVYIQGELEELLGRFRWIAPFVAGVIFGFAHYPQRDMFTVKYCIGFGIIFGLAKTFGKKCNYGSSVLAHMLLDYTNVIFDL